MFTRKLHLILLILVLPSLSLGIVNAQEETNPVPVVESFYNWYLDYTGYDEASGEFRNPLVDGSYMQREELATSLVETIETLAADQGGYHADPFLCAQDVPVSAEYLAVAPDAVLVSLYFGWNPRPHTLLVQLDDDGLMAAVMCRETITPRGTVESFYNDYLETRSVQGATLLTETLQADIASAYENRELGSGDPVLCAQDIPQYVAVDPAQVGTDAATMIVREYFANNPQPYSITVDLVRDDRWQINAITCEVLPETVVALLYNEFIVNISYDHANGIERTPITDWTPQPWAQYMTEGLLNDLVATYEGDEPRMADPFLCAQDVPEWVETTALSASQSDRVSIQVSGAYPAGPDEYTTADLAQVELATGETGQWQIIAVTCNE